MMQIVQQALLCGLWHFTRTHTVKHFINGIQSTENHIHQVCIHRSFAITKRIEHVLGRMAAIHQRVQLQKASTAFYRMESTEDCVQEILIVWTVLQIHQLL